MRVALLLLFSVAACGSGGMSDYMPGQKKYKHKPVVVNPEFNPYLNKFKKMYGLAFHIRVVFAKLEAPTLGLCWFWGDGHREVEIDEESWPNLTENEKEQLIFHELGHCILNREHIEDRGDVGFCDNAPISIMYPNIFGRSACYGDNKDYYFDELIRYRQ